MGEHVWLHERIGRLPAAPAGGRIVVGPGDDAAVVRVGRRPLVLTTDTLVERIHFRRSWITPRALGRRAFGVNASDLAAMGAVPRFALLALEVPGATPVADLDALVGGFAAAAAAAGARLVGGNVAGGSHLAVTAALVGEAVGPVVTRAGARPNDGLYATGMLGAAGLAVRDLKAGRRGRLPDPPRRVRVGVALARVASAMIDVSDGLVQDLGHLCRASGVAGEVDLAALPVARACLRALGPRARAFAAVAGEDYELLFAVRPAREALLRRLARGLECRITRIGRVVAGRPAVRVVGPGGGVLRLPRGGFDHFRR